MEKKNEAKDLAEKLLAAWKPGREITEDDRKRTLEFAENFLLLIDDERK